MGLFISIACRTNFDCFPVLFYPLGILFELPFFYFTRMKVAHTCQPEEIEKFQRKQTNSDSISIHPSSGHFNCSFFLLNIIEDCNGIVKNIALHPQVREIECLHAGRRSGVSLLSSTEARRPLDVPPSRGAESPLWSVPEFPRPETGQS